MLRHGDAAAFRGVVAELLATLVRNARMYVTEAIAEEVVQDTWEAVVDNIEHFESRSSVKTWIYRILLNTVRTRAAREARTVPFAALGNADESSAPSVDPTRLVHPELGNGYWPASPPRWDTLPENRLLGSEVREMIAKAISRLTPAQREVVALRDIEGWTAEEVCNALGISSVNQRVLLHRGRATVRGRTRHRLSRRRTCRLRPGQLHTTPRTV